MSQTELGPTATLGTDVRWPIEASATQKRLMIIHRRTPLGRAALWLSAAQVVSHGLFFRG